MIKKQRGENQAAERAAAAYSMRIRVRAAVRKHYAVGCVQKMPRVGFNLAPKFEFFLKWEQALMKQQVVWKAPQNLK